MRAPLPQLQLRSHDSLWQQSTVVFERHVSKRNRHHERHVSKWTHRISGIECNVEESGINAHVHLKSGEAKTFRTG